MNIKVAYLTFGLAFLLQLVYLTGFMKDLEHEGKANKQSIEWLDRRLLLQEQDSRERSHNE